MTQFWKLSIDFGSHDAGQRLVKVMLAAQLANVLEAWCRQGRLKDKGPKHLK